LGLHEDVAVESLDDAFANEKAQTNAVSVHLAGVLEAPEHLEEIVLIFFLDSNSAVPNRDDKLVLIFRLENLLCKTSCVVEHIVLKVIVVALLFRKKIKVFFV
jgi:hypothetical protein